MPGSRIDIRAGLLFATAISCATSANVAADAWPVKPVRVIIPFPPASGLDVVARLLAPALSERLGQNVVIDNRAGAGGTLGADLAAKAPADGYTLLMISTSHAFNVSMYPHLPYDMLRDLAPITLVAATPNVLVVASSVPATTVKELIALARAKPRALNFASAGSGTSSHLAGELFRSMARVDLVHVPYKGAGAALVALLGGEVQAAFFSIPSTMPHLNSGKLRVLGHRQHAPLGIVAGSADDRRSGRARLRRDDVVRRARAGAHAARDRRQAQSRDRAMHAQRRHARASGGAGR